MALPDESHPGTQFLHARLWSDDPAEQGLKAPFCVVLDEPPVDELDDGLPVPADDRPPARLLQHRRADGRVHVAAAPRGDARHLPGGRRAARGARGRAGAGRLSPGRGRGARCAWRSASGPGLLFMTLHFPDQVETNNLTIEAWDPKSGTAEFKATAVQVEKLAAPAVVAGAGTAT